MIEELLQKLQSEHGLNAEQAGGILNTISGFIKEKFPMAAGMIDNFLPHTQNAGTTANSQGSGDMLDEISNMIPGGAGEKLEELAKSKLGGLFGGDKS
ncbi:MAG TPA: hypothetical protein VG847_00430 [Chitinophagaceae bacterium]|nr:hypothetical protein [Chitinophagaceae bacterium]